MESTKLVEFQAKSGLVEVVQVATTKDTNLELDPITDNEATEVHNFNLQVTRSTTATIPTTTKTLHALHPQYLPRAAFQRSASIRCPARAKTNALLYNTTLRRVAPLVGPERSVGIRLVVGGVETTRVEHLNEDERKVVGSGAPVLQRIVSRKQLAAGATAGDTAAGFGNLRRSQSLRRNYCVPQYNIKTATTTQNAADKLSTAVAQLAEESGNSQQRPLPNGDGVDYAGPTSSAADVESGDEPFNDHFEKMTLKTNAAATATPTTKNSRLAQQQKSPVAARPVTLHTSAATTTAHIKPKSIAVYYNQQSRPHTRQPQELTPCTPPVTPDTPSTYIDDDLNSMYSFATTTSGRSTMSCEHPYVARNGTTFSGRKMKYVIHCSNYAGQVGADYLTPTQRATRQIRRLRELLEQKDAEILRLTREVVELRLLKVSLGSPEERSAASSDGAVTVREAELQTSQDVSPIVDMSELDTSALLKGSPRHLLLQHERQSVMQLSAEMQNSYADSGHFEDMTTSSVHSKDSTTSLMHDMACGSDEPHTGGTPNAEDAAEAAREELIRLYEQRIDELMRSHDAVSSDLKRMHNDKVEALLQKLADCNTRYADIVPDYEQAKERIRELERQLDDLQRTLLESRNASEEQQKKMYLHMYQQGQPLDVLTQRPTSSTTASLNELLQRTQDELENIRAAEGRMNESSSSPALLTAKEAISLWVIGARKTIYQCLLEAQRNRTHVDPEVKLQFLKSAIYYFLTDKANAQGHLQAIISILEFSDVEIKNLSKARAALR